MSVRRRSMAPGALRRALFVDCRGAGLIEYVMLVGLVAILTLAAWKAFGRTLRCAAYRAGVAVATLDAEELTYCPISIPTSNQNTNGG